MTNFREHRTDVADFMIGDISSADLELWMRETERMDGDDE